MSSFEEFHKKWKEKNNITESSPYKKTSNEEIAKAASEYIDKLHEQNRQNTWNQVPNNILKGASSTWNVIQNVAYDNLNKFSTDEFVKNYTNSIANVYNKSNYSKQKTNNFLGNIGKIIENTWLGGLNGIKNFQQSLNQAITNTEINKTKMFENSIPSKYKEEYEKTKKENDFLSLMSSDNLKKEQEESTKKLQEEKNENTEKINQNIEKIDNPIMKKVAELSPSVGQMIPSFVPGIGTIYASGSAKGSYYDDAKQRGMNDDEANTYSAIMGTVEGLTEMIGVENLSKAGKTAKTLISRTGKEITKEGIKQIGKSSIKTALKEYGIGIADNVMQEALIEPIQEVVASTVGGKDKANWDNIGQRMLQSGIDGGLVGIITGGGNLGIQSCVGFIDKVRNGQKPTQQELKKAVQDASKEVDVQKMIVDSTQQVINKYKSSINNEVNNIKQNNENMSNFMQSAQNEQPNVQNYQYVKSDNVKIDSLRQDVSKYFDNSEKTQNFVNMLEKIIQDKDVEIRLDDTLVDNNGNVVNGKYQNGVITINPNSTRAGEFIAIHELTHAIGTKDMIDIVENYRKSNTEFNTAVQDLLKSYNQTEITEEALADVSAQLFGNQEFINNLSQTNPSIFKKIYNEIKYLWHQFRGYKNQNQFIEDLQYKWEQAYKSNNELNDITGYSKQYYKGIGNVAQFDGIDYINDKNISISKNIKKYFDDNFKGKEINNIKLDQGKKYAYPGYKQNNYNEVKAPSVTIIDDIVDIMNNPRYEADRQITKTGKQKKHAGLDTTGGFNHYDIRIGIPDNNGNVSIYNADSITRIDKYGREYFYDLDKIKDTGQKVVDQKSKPITDSSVSNNSILPTQENVNSDTQKYSMQESENNSGSFKLKEKQLEIIQKNNPMQDDYHTGIRNIKDIKTFEETLQDSDWAGYDDFNPDYTRSMAEDAIKTGKITVYSSYPIEQGTFISPSYMEAESYSGDGKVYSKEVNLNDVAWIDPTQGQYAKVESNKYSKQNENWQEYLDNNFKSEGTRTNLQDINLPTKEKMQKSSKALNLPTKETIRSNITQQGSNFPTKKTLNPTEISNLSQQDASTTPNLPTRNYKKGNKESSFYSNITESSQFLNESLRDEMAKEGNIQYYQGITNKETLEKAYTQLQDGGQQETLNWFTKEGKNVDATDVAKGWVLLKQYQDNGDYQSAVEVAKKMRELGTKAGQTVQAYNILSRLTPEGMFYYAQSELTEAYNKMVEGKSQKWIEENRGKFELTPTETQFIKDTMQEVSKMEEGYDKKVKLAEIQKMLTDKIPPTTGQSVKAWMRISMLFNPKTQVRNVSGNAVILPVNATSDFISSGIDKVISKKTGVRTTGNLNLKNYGKGFGKGLYESYNDFRKGINTRDIEGNRFEVSEGKSFKNKGIGKALNRVDNILSFMLDAGDRGFYEATFTNSINNQLTLNNTTEVTQDMIDIATNEALQRTWQDNNAYTESVLKIRNILNKVNIKVYGLGDVIIPFAKTPANLTKAIVDYSPIGLTKAITADAIKFKNSLSNGQYTPQMQHKLVQNIGKGMAGTFLYVLGYGLAKAGIATGEADDDKDVKNFMKNSLGISSYSLKIGDKTFSYDWAQPVATPLAIMTNYFKYSQENPEANIIDKAIKSLNIGTEQLLQQSFMESLNTILNGKGTTLENLSQSILELPSRAIPTFSKQIADMVDENQRISFEYDKPVQSAINSIKAKIPGLSKSLPTTVDTLGNEIKKYGGENNWFNVLLNPANVNRGQLSKAGGEIYRLYEQTGSTTVFPITAPYYVNSNGEKITMTSEERSKYQEISGQYTEKAIKDLLSNNEYKKLSDNKKVELIEDIISDSNAKAKYDVLKIESKDAKKKRELIEKVTPKYYYDYLFKTKNIEGDSINKKKNEIIVNANYPNKIKSILYKNTTGSEDDLYNNILSKYDININEYLNYKLQEFESDKEDDGTLQGKSISGSKKKKVNEYVNSMDITLQQKIAIIGTQYKLNRNEQKDLYNYINNIPNQTKDEKLEIFKKYSKNFTIYQDGTISFK